MQPARSVEAVSREVLIPIGPMWVNEMHIGPLTLKGDLIIPRDARSIVVFAHGSGSSRLSPRNRLVANILNVSGLATLLFDLLTSEEARVDSYTMQYRFDIPRLAGRLVDVVRWVAASEPTRDMPCGLFGASTGAAAAIMAAAELGDTVGAVVSRGGRPDLAGPALPAIQCPTLLIVGDRDFAVIELNRSALAEMGCGCELALVPGATHLFEEPGTLESAAELAADWFGQHLAADRQ